MNVLADCLAQGSTVLSMNNAPPPATDWSDSGEGIGEYSRPGAKAFTFKCSKDFVNWKYRWPLLRNQLLSQNADIICVEEVDKKGWDNLEGAMDEIGYEGAVQMKLRTTVRRGRRPMGDGVAMFWKASRLEAVDELLVKFADSVQVALLKRFAVKVGCVQRHVVVAVTHLKAGLTRKWEGVRLAQAKDMLKKLRKFSQPGDELIVCGDMNSHCRDLPSLKMPAMVYSYLIHNIGGTKDNKPLHSAYSYALSGQQQSSCEDEPPFSYWAGWTDHEVKCVFDYIFTTMHTDGVLDVPNADQLPDVRLPNEHYPSDHLVLVADLDLLEKPKAVAVVKKTARSECARGGVPSGALEVAVTAVVLAAAAAFYAASGPFFGL
jgi:mRNA deadenylase 3'-5' endonuclease subunit Ccr4